MSEKPVMKLCLSESGKKHWIRTRFRFLRKGDLCKILYKEDSTDSGILLVKSDPYKDKDNDWIVDVAT